MTLTAPPRPSSDTHPALSPAAEAVVRATAGVVAEHSETISARFYESMLGERPELWRLFNRANQETGEQSRALAASVVGYAVQLIDPDAPSFEPVLRRIAGKHITLGITPEQYTLVGRHLLGAVADILGAASLPPSLPRGTRSTGCSPLSSSPPKRASTQRQTSTPTIRCARIA